MTINVFGGGTFADVFVAEGIWNEGQVDPSYDGSPARFIAEDGAIAQQGFASAEPFKYENDVHRLGQADRLPDAARRRLRGLLADAVGAPGQARGPASCLEAFVPIVQQAAIDFIADPERANAIIVDAVAQYDTFWTYSPELADVLRRDPEGARLRRQRPRRHARQHGRGADPGRDRQDPRRRPDDVPEDLVAADLFTNEFIDESIGMP